jgi:hypothetical protein
MSEVKPLPTKRIGSGFQVEQLPGKGFIERGKWHIRQFIPKVLVGLHPVLRFGSELGTTQDLACTPLGELYLGLGFKRLRDVVGHFVGGDAFAETAGARGREVGKGAYVGSQWLEEFVRHAEFVSLHQA